MTTISNVGLYSFENEHDACGVGLVADLKNIPSHNIITASLTVLKNLMHRGATGGDSETGDGAGILSAVPDEFFRKNIKSNLPQAGKYGIAMIFGGTGSEEEIEKIIQTRGGEIICWRDVPLNISASGAAARETCPVIRQLFIGGKHFKDGSDFERRLFVMRRVIEKTVRNCYVCSMSSKSIVYKGLLLATQIEGFYPDLTCADFKSPLAIVHQRYSTNTLPTWELAHPFRYLAHNGEINTLRGNLNHLKSREPYFKSDLLGESLSDVLPLIKNGQSDSASLDNMFELLVASGRNLCHAMLMMIPQAWGENYHMSRDVRGFFEYHSALMEPWDGPAAVAFSDGVNAGAILDRNGLRPARYTITDDNVFILASEAGVLDIPEEKIVKKGRLRPGEIIYCDLENHRLVYDDAVKKKVARSKPYRRWVNDNKISVHGLFVSVTPSETSSDILKRQKLFGYSREDMERIIKPMAEKGQEPVGSMGNDASLAILSEKPHLLFSYFKQLFAQVTNPPIDPIREDLVMSLLTYIGNRGNILTETPEHARLIKLPRPILTDDEINRLRHISGGNFKAINLTIGFTGDMQKALDTLCRSAIQKVMDGFAILILSDKNLDDSQTPIPSLLAVAAVNKALSNAGMRSETGLIIETGEAREVMHFALLLGYGATAINPYLALECVTFLSENGNITKDKVTAAGNYINAVDKGILKSMSKMGISTLRSYRSGQLFEAVGLDSSVVNKYFAGTASRIGGITIEEIAAEAEKRKKDAECCTDMLPSGGQYSYRKDGEHRLWTPESITAFRHAVQMNDRGKYYEYSALINEQAERLCTLRGLFELSQSVPVPISEVESADSIIKRFVSGAMSMGAISPEAHETIAVAMNRLGAMSNCGEGGENAERWNGDGSGENKNSAIKQIASGRFGVTIDYLSHAKELQIKIAQGAKPGEGGQLPGHKVDDFIAKLRHSMPNVSLISPPPHHDIYSIEDLAQLIYDLRNSNPEARISVKLVSEVGVGTVAAGVAKAHADMILISGYDGGTGAAPLTSIKHAGIPWELGLAETQQTLVLNKLRGRVKLQVDGQIKTGKDVVIAALLGAEEFGFATTILVCLGCIMMRRCHDNICPAGIATQNPELRKRFAGKPEYIENFLRFVAEEAREYLAKLGLRSINEAIGRSDLLKMNKAIDFYKSKNLDFSKIFETVNGKEIRFVGESREELKNYDREYLIPYLKEAVEKGKKTELSLSIKNTDRTIGTELSHRIALKHGAEGLKEDTIKLNFTGCAGQSFGAFLASGVTFALKGQANDFVGKGLSGGKIIIEPPENAGFDSSENVIAGNVIGYGGTKGKMFINGQVGERFAIRNSGLTMVAEGVGDHGCEYMTGGRVVVLGPTGVNFGAGMTGGLAYVLDETNDFDLRCNMGTIDLENIEKSSDDEAELFALLEEHLKCTGSPKTALILTNWECYREKFVKVFPVEYRQALNRMTKTDKDVANGKKRTI